MWTALVGVAVFLGIILALAVFLPMGRAFSRELRYLNMKLMNSRSDKEQAYWEKRKKSLWLSLIPFRSYSGSEDHHHHHHHHD